MARLTFSGPIRSKGGWSDMVVANEVLTYRLVHTKITTAEVLALGTTAIEVIPAVGSGNYFKLDRAVLYQDYAGTAYTDGGSDEDPVIQLGGGGAALTETVDSAVIDEAGDFLVWFSVLPVTASAASTSVVWTQLPTNSSAEIKLGGDVLAGTSDWDVLCWYYVFNGSALEGLTV